MAVHMRRMPELLQPHLTWVLPVLTAAWLLSYLVRSSIRTFSTRDGS